LTRQPEDTWLPLRFPSPSTDSARNAFDAHARQLALLVERNADDAAFEVALDAAIIGVPKVERTAALSAAMSVITDLARQRWAIRVTDVVGELAVRVPAKVSIESLAEKARIRNQELVKRNEQLRQPATREFVLGVASPKGLRRSVYSLFRDGRELAQSLRRIRAMPASDRIVALRAVIDPYLQFVDGDARCEHTRLRLKDIWRYFRHTWTNQYVNTPGRTMAFLVRDRSQPNHPVIGIGALGSPIVQIRERDVWLGWHPESFLESLLDAPSPEFGVWLLKTVDTAIDELYVTDFFEEGLLGPGDLHAPTTEVFARLIAFGEAQREKHHRFAVASTLKRDLRLDRSDDGSEHWRSRSVSHLYKSKRALTLADMLQSRSVLRHYLGAFPTPEGVSRLIASTEGIRTIKKVLRKAKADRVGIAMADITVCGAVAPYAPLVGGKLVSMLAASPEVVDAYQRRYREQESEIASAMAGRPIVRPSHLVFLGTTSLYGVGSSQYNRLRMPADRLGGRVGEWHQFIEIGRSEAYGTSHFSARTVEALVTLVQQSSNGQRVNSIFGEGVSPKLRKIRAGLDRLGFPTDALLHHGRPRIVYGVPLARNHRAYLLGMDPVPEYVFSLDDPKASTSAITSWWMERWLARRIESDGVLDEVARHTLVRDGAFVLHGACVHAVGADEEQPALFDDVDH
jgi:hypothetical protein